MKNRFKIRLCFLFMLNGYLALQISFAQVRVIALNNADTSFSIGRYTSILIDKTNSLSDSVVAQSPNFQKSPDDIPVFEVIGGSIWLKFSIVNHSENQSAYLNLDYANISNLFLYRLVNNQMILLARKGNDLSFGIQANPNFVFSLVLPQRDTLTYFIKVNSKHPVLLPIFLQSNLSLQSSLNTQTIILFLYFGIIISLLLYNFFIFLSTRDLSYLVYIIYLFFMGFAQLTLTGYGFKFFWPYFPQANSYILIMSSALAGIAGILFSLYFLHLKSFLPKFIPFLWGCIVLYSFSMILSVFTQNALGYKILNYAGSFAGLILIIASGIIAFRGFRPAFFYFIAWLFLLSGVVIFSLRNLGVLPYNNFTTYVLYIGSAIETILLSLALADRINVYKKEKEKSREEALKASRENEKLVREQNIFLEQKVVERTAELESINSQLNVAIDNLKDAQTQLVEAEKMASLGQLTAGIAHEINNPINFVKSSIKPLRLDINDLFEIICYYNQQHSQNSNDISVHLRGKADILKRIDIDLIKNEIHDLIGGIEDGAQRTAEIVSGLRTFSRLDENSLKEANIHEGIESTLVLLRNSTPDFIKIIKEFNANGNIECYPGKMNQVFLNIINNAIQAINAKKERTNNEVIAIKTWDTDDGKIKISIKDSGIGMTEEVKHKVFEPFFTTKNVGEGTGLGMAIVFRIVEEHHGKIEIVSQHENGAEFILTLPHIYKATDLTSANTLKRSERKNNYFTTVP